MTLRLNGSTSGYVELDAPAIAGATALTLPTIAGTLAVQGYAYGQSATATVATVQTTTSATFTDLATVGPSVTLVTGTKALIAIACMNTTSVADFVVAGVAVSGATTLAASDLYAIGGYTAGVNVPQTQAANAFMLTGLTAGSNTFTMKYRRASGTASFSQRIITVIDMGS